MTPKEIAQSYDHLASHWNGDSFNRKNGMAAHQRALAFTKQRGWAIDVGCGSSGRFIEWLLSEGFSVEGLDLSANMLEFARLRHPEVRFHHADICEYVFTRSYDFITAWDSIWHAPLAAQPKILSKLCAALSEGGVLIFTAGGLDGPDEVTNPCQGQPLYHATLGIPRLLQIIDEAGCVCRHLEYDQYPEKHIYFIVQKPDPATESTTV